MLTMSSGFIQQIVTIVFSFISRTILIKTLGAEYLGISGLFTNILTIFALAELGIGAAITFYLYKPIADSDKERIKTLMHFYKVCYRCIGIAILIIGLCLIPFLNKIINFNTKTDINIYVVFICYLLNSVTSYLFFAYKNTIITTNQQGYLINSVGSIIAILSCMMESCILIVYHDFVLSIIVKVGIGILKNLVIAKMADHLFPYIKEKDYKKLEKKEIKKIFKDVYSIFIFRSAATLFTSTDNILISILIGTVYVGYNSNYTMIITAITSISAIVFNSFRASVGNVIATENIEKQVSIFYKLDFINYWIISFSTVSLNQLLNPFITIWIGSEYTFDQLTVNIIVFNFFIVNLLNVIFLFRETIGIFQYGKYRQLIGGVVNIILDIMLGNLFGIIGIFGATLISNIFITVLPFPKILFKYGFGVSTKVQYIRMLKYIIVTMLTGFILELLCSFIKEITVFTFIIQVILCIVIPNFILFIIHRKSEDYIYFKNILVNLKNKILSQK